MSSPIPLLPLKYQNDIEQLRSWEGISTPADLLKLAAARLSVDVNSLLRFEEVVYTDVEPTGESRKKIWIKTDDPVAVGIPSGEKYTMIYQYPVNVPFIWMFKSLGNVIPSYSRVLTATELTDLNLTAPKETAGKYIIIEL